MRYVFFFILTTILSSCHLEKSVRITTNGYEPYRRINLTDSQIKALQNSNASHSDSITIYNSKKVK